MAEKGEQNGSNPVDKYQMEAASAFPATEGNRPYASNRKIKDMIDRAERVMNNFNFKG